MSEAHGLHLQPMMLRSSVNTMFNLHHPAGFACYDIRLGPAQPTSATRVLARIICAWGYERECCEASCSYPFRMEH